MDAALAGNRKRRGQTDRQKYLAVEKRAAWLQRLIAKEPNSTLDEVVAAMRKRRIAGRRSALWRFFTRHGISFKKACARRSKSEPTCAARTREIGRQMPTRSIYKERWLSKSAQRDKWSFCLTAAKMAAEQERR